MTVSGDAALPPNEPRTGQIAFVVDDLLRAIEDWIALGVGPWRIWTFDERMLASRTYRGEEGTYAARVALCSIGPLTYELIEVLSGPSIWEPFLGGRRAATHHLGYYVDNIDEAVASMAAQGFDAVQTGAGFGVDGDGAFAYFDTVDAFGCYFEAIESPGALPPPEAVLPPS
ncbi:MAG: methylmalonyl-CoA/ethylmalonyl-CoA epimerase [Actinomycetota bacterium]|jgi:catechol 2,3-dioxygenase-like lactoylglutathione lyase family enzyme